MRYELSACSESGFCIQQELPPGDIELGGMFCDNEACVKELEGLHIHINFKEMITPGVGWPDFSTAAACSEACAMAVVRDGEQLNQLCICGDIGVTHDPHCFICKCPVFDDARQYLPTDHPEHMPWGKIEVTA